MAAVPGVGDAKLARYGPAFLAVIAEHAGGERSATRSV
jgi:ATP-dependent DNA helicase RecQ